MGHVAVAADVRTDGVDGLGAAAPYARHLSRMFARVAASFQGLPFASGAFDLAVFNASLHYALDLATALAEVARVVRGGGAVAVLDSPFYRRDESGDAMVAEKRAGAARVFGDLAPALASPRFIEYLTLGRLEAARPGLVWHRVRVLYPLHYEVRPLIAWLRGAREPSRFDVWWAEVPSPLGAGPAALADGALR
jgi:SAM-dependent methyltransferase